MFRNSKIKITICKNLIVNLNRKQIPLILKENHEAQTIAEKFVNNFICKFGISKKILTD